MRKYFVIGEAYEYDNTFRTLGGFDNVIPITYQSLMQSKSKLASGVPVFLCFPYSLWNNDVEDHNILYGGRDFGVKINNLAERIYSQCEKIFPDAIYVNHPMSMVIERDKEKTKQILSENGIQVPTSIDKNVESILDVIRLGHSVYIKVRFGSMGKGISYLSPKKWTTNFNYDGRVIKNHDDDNSWVEIDVTGDISFLEQLLDEDVVVEKAVQNSKTNGLKFDLRGRCIFGSVSPEFAYGRVTEELSITNISQGARRVSIFEMKDFVPENSILDALNLIERSSRTVNLNYSGGDVLFEGDDFIPVLLELNSFPGPYSVNNFFDKLNKQVFDNLCR